MNFKYSPALPEMILLPGTTARMLHFTSDSPDCVKAVLVISSSSALVDSDIDQRQIQIEDFCRNFEEDIIDRDKRLKNFHLAHYCDTSKNRLEREELWESEVKTVFPFSVFCLYFPERINQAEVIWAIDNAIKNIISNYNVACVVTRRNLMTEVEAVLQKQSRETLQRVYTWPKPDPDSVSDPVLPYTNFVYEDKTLKEQIDEVKNLLVPKVLS